MSPAAKTFGSFLTCASLLFVCTLITGCGGDKSYRVSGRVTFKGEPIPAGKIYFVPDGARGNTGPTGYADISNGSYDTDSGGRGTAGGPVIVVIEGIDPDSKGSKEDPEVVARSLFPQYEVQDDLPKSDSTKDFDVPAEAIKGKTTKEGKPLIIP
jgi:hypothetical protein